VLVLRPEHGLRGAPPALGEQIVNLGEAAEYMFDHNIFQENLVGVDFCEKMVAETNPGVLDQANRTESPHAEAHGYKTIGDIMRSLNPFSGEFYREALQVSRYTREMFCLMEGRHVHPSTLYPGGVGTTATIQLFTDYYTRLMRYVEFMKRVVPMHDDLFDFFYQAMPGYEEVGNRRILLGCWGAFQDPEVCNFDYRDMTKWGRAMGVTPGVVVDGKLVTNDLVDINLGIRILLGHSFYDDWEDQEMFVTQDPWAIRSTGATRGTSTRTRSRRSATSTASTAGSWPALVRRQGPPRSGHRRAAPGPPVVDGSVGPGQHRPSEGNRHSVRSTSRRPLSKARGRPRVEDPAVVEHHRAGPGPNLLPGVRRGRRPRLHREGARRRPRGNTKTWEPFEVPDEAIGCGFTEAVRGRAVASHGHQGRQDRQLPPVPADAVERQPARQLRNARSLRGRGHRHPHLRGERPRALQGHRHHEDGAQLRPVPALRGPHVPRQGQGV
jgi:hydrogenase large subunit